MRSRSNLAAFVVSGILLSGTAYAADPVVFVEPEAQEYVRICDVYGAGFFYIPGTETCLRVSGFARFQVGATQGDDSFRVRTRGRLNLDARSDTEWGTLRGFIRLQGEVDRNVQRGVVLDQAYIELGGLRVGFLNSVWNTSQRAGVGQDGSHSSGGLSYADQKRSLISYTFQGPNGFSSTFSLEDNNDPTTFMPDIVATAHVNQDWGGLWAKVGYDNAIDDLGGPNGWAAQAGTQINVPNSAGSSFRLIGFYANNDNAYSVGSRWSVLGSYQHRFTSQFAASVGGQYFDDVWATGSDGWQGEISLVWTPVRNLEVRTEYTHTNFRGMGATNTGFLRFQRNF